MKTFCVICRILSSSVVVFLVMTLLHLPTAEAAKTIRFAFEGGKASPYAKAVEIFKKEVQERTGGSLKVNIFYGGSLAGGSEAMQMVKMGMCEMYMDVTAPVGTFMYPKLLVFDVPYLFKDLDHQIAVLNSSITRQLTEEVAQTTGVRILDFWPAHFRVLAATKEIRTPEDIKGQKVRSVQSEMNVELWKRIGALPVTLPWGEIYTSLATNLIVGIAASPQSLLTSKFTEVCKYFILTEHQSYIELFLINEKFYQGLNDTEKLAVNEGMKKAKDYFMIAGVKGNDEFPNPLEIAKANGITIVTPDKAAFAARLEGIEKLFIPDSFSQELYDEIKNFTY